MCLPAAAIGLTASQAAAAQLGLAVASAGATYAAQAASVRAANAAARENQRSAVLSAGNQYRSIIAGQIQEEDAASEEIARIERDAAAAESTALLAGIEAGAGGRSLIEKTREFRASALNYSSAVRRNQTYSRGAAAGNLHAVSLEAEGRVRGFRPQYQAPSLLGAGLTIAGGYLDAQRFLAPGGYNAWKQWGY